MPGAAEGQPTVCTACGAPWLVQYARLPSPSHRATLADRPWTMWRYLDWLPLEAGEDPVTLGEGGSPLLRAASLERSFGLRRVWIKDEGQNPCGSFKARGLAMGVTRARGAGARVLTMPTAGNAGVALAAYGAHAGLPVRVFVPRATPPTILSQIRHFGADLRLVDGHIGDCGRAARDFAAAEGATDLSTLREPYRLEGKKTLGFELAEQFGWTLPDVVIYPTGGGTGLLGMWKAFRELREAGWTQAPMPRLFSVQADGCAPVVRAFASGADRAEPWKDPETVAVGLRVPDPIGGSLILRALRESEGGAVAVSDAALTASAERLARDEGIDACPEGGATIAALASLVHDGRVSPDDSIVLFNTGAGWLYR